MVEMLRNKFGKQQQPKYIIEEISASIVQEKCVESRLEVFNTLDCSSKFEIMFFQPNLTTYADADRICLRQQCKDEYGSCSLFQDFYLLVTQLKETGLKFNDTQHGEKPLTELLLPNSVCAIAANNKSSDTLWLVLILEQNVDESNEPDDYGHTIPKGCSFITGHYLEKCGTVRKKQKIKIMVDKKAYIYKESIIYAFVNLEKRNFLFIIYDNDLCDMSNYVEHYGMADI